MVAEPVTAETTLAPPEIGDNSQEEKHFRDALVRQIALNEERNELNGRITKARKEMKAKGVVLGKLDSTIAMLNWSPAEVREYFAVQARYARYARLPVGTQLDLMELADDADVVKADWISRGYAAGISGKPGTPPDNCPPENHQDFMEGYNGSSWWRESDVKD